MNSQSTHSRGPAEKTPAAGEPFLATDETTAVAGDDPIVFYPDAAMTATIVPLSHPGDTIAPRLRGRSAFLGWWNSAPANLRSSIILLVAILSFTAMTIFIKVVGRRIPLVEILTIRQFVMQLLIMPFSIGDFPAVLRTQRPGMQVFRGLLQLGAMCLTFAAVVRLPLALSTTISFSYALFVTVGAGTILKEKIGFDRWIATAVGLAGVVIMLRPTGTDGASLVYSLIAILGAVFAAASAVSLRLVPGAERADTILTYQALVLLGALAVPTALQWVSPTFDEWMVLVLVGVSGTVGQWLLTVAYKTGEAAALAPLDFVRLILTVICGLVFFGESLDGWEIAGAAVLIGATAYTFRANAVRSQKMPAVENG